MTEYRKYEFISDSQMVTHLLWITHVGSVAARMAHSASTSPPSYTSCCAARDLLLYHYWLAELATGKVTFLVHFRDHNRNLHRV